MWQTYLSSRKKIFLCLHHPRWRHYVIRFVRQYARPSVLLSHYHDISRTAWGMNFKLDDSLYHHRKTIWLDFMVTRSKIKGHRCRHMKLQAWASLSRYLKNPYVYMKYSKKSPFPHSNRTYFLSMIYYV